jgi:subtilisin family serine protease
MNWNVKVGNKTLNLKRVESVRAVYPTSEFRSTATHEDFQSSFGEMMPPPPSEPESPEVAHEDTPIFEKAGWHFVAPNEEVAKATAVMAEVPNATAAREVYVSDTGSLMVGTDLATVKLPPDLCQAEAEKILQQDGLTIVHKLGFGQNLYEVRVPAGAPLLDTVNKLEATGRYLWVEPSLLQAIKQKQIATPLAVPKDPEFEFQWHHRNLGVNFDSLTNEGTAGEDLDSLKAWQITKGKGVKIAIIDAGMEITHPDLAPGLVGGGYFDSAGPGDGSFIPLEPGMPFPNDRHGTLCMGLAGARMKPEGQLNAGGCGIAPEAGLIAIACPLNNLATHTTLARAIHFAVDPSAFIPTATPEQGADVISCSLAPEGFSVLAEAINFAATEGRKRNGVSLGVPIFWAVDNKAGEIADDPVCSLPAVIAVGKYDRSGDWAGGATGPELAFLAPGIDVFSTVMGGRNELGSGTSYATPLAAGVGALVLSIHPEWTAVQVREKLLQSCEPVLGPDNSPDEVGAGKLNAFLAVS